MSTRPELCEDCKLEREGKRHRAHCHMFPITCSDQRELWDAGYHDAMALIQGLLVESKLVGLERRPAANEDNQDLHYFYRVEPKR